MWNYDFWQTLFLLPGFVFLKKHCFVRVCIIFAPLIYLYDYDSFHFFIDDFRFVCGLRTQ